MRLAQYHGTSQKIMRLLIGGGHEKEIRELERENVRLQRGNLKKVAILDMPGYVLQRRVSAFGHGSLHKKILEKCIELYGKKYAVDKTKQLLARIVSYPILGVGVSMALGACVLAVGKTLPGVGLIVIGSLLVLVLTYAMYDELADKLNKRRASISRQFPNVVSKLALLVTSGMIVSKAWRLTADSQEHELYQEMRKTAEELENLVAPTTAYTNFIDRCNTKETTKLASALIQNQSKGNSEIGVLLKSMASEAWQERRHTAKRDSEAANSKLMIPTMMLFITIMIIIMVPVVMNFANLM